MLAVDLLLVSVLYSIFAVDLKSMHGALRKALRPFAVMV